MTNEELLQQAKDQVARKEGYADWSGYYFRIREFEMLQALDKAACLAIQTAREEGYSLGHVGALAGDGI